MALDLRVDVVLVLLGCQVNQCLPKQSVFHQRSGSGLVVSRGLVYSNDLQSITVWSSLLVG